MKTPVLESLFNKHRCLPVNIAKILTTAIFTEHFRWLFIQKLDVFFVTTESTYFSNRLSDFCKMLTL